ncbi:MAG: hypothetical protein HOV77_20905 [Hamadaea sp.]|uniref:hypothetical protein n=1 Tax=Hamadaea sp. TaxID=2024425 RepID=UPI001810193B|nr:hypothetical protein [Hamadaea sp.]NUT21644.1 hypothetical protein [Hamadaea sp.]
MSRSLGERLGAVDEKLLAPIARGYRRIVGGRRRPHSLTVAACLVAGAVLAVAVWQADRAAPASDMSVGQVVKVGVEPNASIPEYAESSRAELDKLAAEGAPEAYALVTFSEYLAPDRLTPILTGVAVSAVYVRVPTPGVQTEIVRIPVTKVPVDVVTGMEQIADRKNREATEYAAKLSASPTDRTPGGSPKRLPGSDLVAVYESGQRVATAERDAYAKHCACAYAAVVRATPAALEPLSHRPDVRVVDVAPEIRRLDRAVFWPPLPEQRTIATPPGDSRS